MTGQITNLLHLSNASKLFKFSSLEFSFSSTSLCMGLGLHQNLDLWGTQIPSIYQLAVGVPMKEYFRPASRKTKSCVKVLDPSCILAAIGLPGLA